MRILRSIIGTFVSLSLLLALALSPAFAQPAFDPPGLERAIEAQEQHTDVLLGIQGVVGTAVGLGTNGGAVVKIYTERSGIGGLPRSLDGVPVVVQVTGKIHALHHRPGHSGGPGGPGGGGGEEVDPTATFPRPVPIGVSSGTERLIDINGQLYCTVGTIGARVKDNSDNLYTLSNAHVYALEGSDPYGDVQVGDRILQPGRVDMTEQACGSTTEIDAPEIGTLSAFVQLDFSGGYNTVDAAIALDSTGSVGNATPSDGYGTPSSMTASAFVGQTVQKYGRTTSLTLGTVTGINATVNVGYDNGTAKFVGQIIIQGSNGAFSGSGDSGSLIVTQIGNNPVALLFAGSSTITVGNPIDLVLSRFNVKIDGEEPLPTGTISGTVTDSSTGVKIGGVPVSTDTGETTVTSSDGTYTLTDVSTGERQVTTSASGYASQTTTDTVVENQTTTVDFALDPETTTTSVSVVSFTYATEGGKNNDKHLLITVALVDSLDNPVSGASVSIELDNTTTGQSWSGTATTGGDGKVTFTLKNAPSGCYTTTVTNVIADGLTWNSGDSSNVLQQSC